jgi:hypothetical protein
MAVKRGRGRPRRVASEIASERIWAWLTKSERVALSQVADETGMDIAVVIREAVNDYVSDYSERRHVFSVTGNSTARPS